MPEEHPAPQGQSSCAQTPALAWASLSAALVSLIVRIYELSQQIITLQEAVRGLDPRSRGQGVCSQLEPALGTLGQLCVWFASAVGGPLD